MPILIPQKYQSGLKNVAYDYSGARTAETAVIYSYLSGEIPASEARDKIPYIRNSFVMGLTKTETYTTTDPDTGKPTTETREVRLPVTYGQNYVNSFSAVS